MKRAHILIALVAALVLGYCIHLVNQDTNRPRTHTVVHNYVRTFRMSDGSIAYHGTDNFWYWYVLYSVSQPPSSRSSSVASSVYNSPGGPGYWSRQSYSPFSYPRPNVRLVEGRDEELAQLEEETGEELPSAPVIESETVEEPLTNEEGQPSAQEPEAEPESSPATEEPPSPSESSEPSSSSSDSGSSDSGGGSSE